MCESQRDSGGKHRHRPASGRASAAERKYEERYDRRRRQYQCRKSTGGCVVAMLPSPLPYYSVSIRVPRVNGQPKPRRARPGGLLIFIGHVFAGEIQTFTTWSKVSFIGSSPLNMVRRTAFTPCSPRKRIAFVHGTWTRPATGSQVSPDCSSATLALSTWATADTSRGQSPPSGSPRPLHPGSPPPRRRTTR